ncbi:hypothetical protein ACA910_017189 [Epithemia clementina (nom. ined.)]
MIGYDYKMMKSIYVDRKHDDLKSFDNWVRDNDGTIEFGQQINRTNTSPTSNRNNTSQHPAMTPHDREDAADMDNNNNGTTNTEQSGDDDSEDGSHWQYNNGSNYFTMDFCEGCDDDSDQEAVQYDLYAEENEIA